MNLRIVYLRARQRANTLSDLQKKELFTLLADPANASQFEELTEELWANPASTAPVFNPEESQAMLSNVLSAIKAAPVAEQKTIKLKPNSLPLWIKISAAAVLIGLSAALFFYINPLHNPGHHPAGHPGKSSGEAVPKSSPAPAPVR